MLVLGILCDILVVCRYIQRTKRISRSENTVWNKNTNRCKNGFTSIGKLVLQLLIFLFQTMFASGYSFCYKVACPK